MTDGPFKNLNLGRCWKRLEQAVQNDAASPGECGRVASYALAQHLGTRETGKLLGAICAHLGQVQQDLHPLVSIEAIFSRHEKTPFLDSFRKEVLYRANDMPLRDALAPALDSALDTQIREIRNRFHEEFIRAQEDGEMTREAADRARRKVDAAFDAVKSEKVRDALLEGRRDAFEKDLGKSDGVDEGMVLL